MTRNFGRYKVAEELGRGAMGVVYRAVDPVIGRTVAIKAINHAYLESVGVRGEEYQARFEREAQVAGGLDHPNIVKIFDLGPDYLVLEHVEGQTLATRLREQGPLDRETALRVVHETAAALDYAHGLGVVHRDIKPGNVMLTRQGAIKVMDFGLARLESSTLTAAGEILGSAAYMAPEVIQGQPADARADNFALAVMAYELLTGERPFGGATVSAIIHNVVRSQPRSPRELNRQLPPEYDAIFSRAFAKDPSERYERALDFAEALASCTWADTAGGSTVRLAAPATAAGAVPAEGDAGAQTVMMVDAQEVGEPATPAATVIMAAGALPAPPARPAGDVDATVVPVSPPTAAPVEPEAVAATVMMKAPAPPEPPAPAAEDTSATVVTAPPPAIPSGKPEPEAVAATIMMKPPTPPAAEAEAVAATIMMKPPAPPAAPKETTSATVVTAPAPKPPAAAPPAPVAPAPPRVAPPPAAQAPGAARPPKPPAPPAPAAPSGAIPPAPAAPAKKSGSVMMVLGLGFGIVVLFGLGVVASWLFVRSQTRVPQPASTPVPVAEATPAPTAPPTAPAVDATPEATPEAEATPAPAAPSTPPPAATEATLVVQSTPAGASVLVKGKRRGATPLRLKVPAGAVTVRVEKDGFKTWSQDLKVQAGETRTLAAQLESAAPPPPVVVATPPPTPKAAAVREGDLVPMGPDVTPPKRLKGDSPAPRRNQTGSVLVEFTVGIDGKPADLKVVESGGESLDEAVLKAIKTYRYEPASSHGVKVRVLQRARFNFTK